MLGGSKAARVLMAWVVCLTMAGCMSLPALMFPMQGGAAKSTQPQDEVPLVPVPPPPLGQRSDDRRLSPVPQQTDAPPLARPNNPTPAILPISLPDIPTSTTPTPRPAAPALAAPSQPPPIALDVPSTPGQLYKAAVDAYTPIESYIARMTRREQVNGTNKPEEVMLFKFRKSPWSVYFKWLGDTGRGREAVYVKGRHEDKIHSLVAAGDVPFTPAGKRFSIQPDSLFVRSASRHPITQAGIGASITRLGIILDGINKGDTTRGTLKVLGRQVRPDYTEPLDMLEHIIPAGSEAELPRGGRRLYGFAVDNHLPVLVVAYDSKGQEVEYYRYDRVQFPVSLDDDDFDPDRLWVVAKP